jgi:hypothetical protein
MVMETASCDTVFAADKINSAAAPVKEEGPSAEGKSFISTSSGGSSWPAEPAVPTHQQAKVI